VSTEFPKVNGTIWQHALTLPKVVESTPRPHSSLSALCSCQISAPRWCKAIEDENAKRLHAPHGDGLGRLQQLSTERTMSPLLGILYL
jgi:hypothetical protein